MQNSKTILCALLLVTTAHALEEAMPRQVAAPPEDFLSGRVRLPDPREVAPSAHSAWLPVELQRDRSGRWSWESELPVGVDGRLSLGWIGAGAYEWRISLGRPAAGVRPLEDWVSRGEAVTEGRWQNGMEVQRVELRAAVAGMWRLRVEAEGPGSGWLAARDAGKARTESWVGTWSTLAGGEVPVLVRAFAADDPARTSRTEWIESAELVFAFDGGELREPMFADGSEEAGVFTAFVPPHLSGELRFRVEVRGVTDVGELFLRTTHHAIHLAARAMRLTGDVRAGLLDEGRTRLAVVALLNGAADRERKWQLSAELWGTNEAGVSTPIVWLSRVLLAEDSARRDPEVELPLALDARWVAMARARAPYELRRVRVQDPDIHVVLASAERLVIGDLPLASILGTLPNAPNRAMLAAPWTSVAPIGPKGARFDGLTPRTLVLSHGHCSGGNPWPQADFSPPLRIFSDPNSDRTNEEFAQILLTQTSDLSSFGIVAHSQGGLAALHLYTFYVSGLDRAVGGRRIQSVASPYQGTPLANFSAGCGTHNDLTPSEAAAWLANIPTWARAEVWFRTVSAAGQACNGFTDFLLTDPEDGVIETFRGDLPGGNPVGDIPGWCHTTGMNWPACYTDHVRNQEMNSLAAR
jgi:hypothetical protein